MAVQLVEIVRRLQGKSQPIVMRAGDGDHYVAKLRCHSSPKILANEMLGSRLAELLGLPAAKSEVVYLEPKLVMRLMVEDRTGPGSVDSGPHLGSRLIMTPQEGQIFDAVPKNRRESISNLDDLIGIRVFDLWLGNSEPRKLIYSRRFGSAQFSLSMIDHSQCFGCAWVRPLRSLREEVFGFGEWMAKWWTWVERIHSIPAESIQKVLDVIPGQWEMTEEDKIWVQGGLKLRKAMLGVYTEQLIMLGRRREQ